MLSDLELKPGVQAGAHDGEWVIAGDPRVGKTDREIGSAAKSLGVIEIAGGRILHRTAKNTGALEARMVALQGCGHDRVEAGNERSEPQGGTHQAVRTTADSARGRRGSARARAYVSTQTTHSAAGSVLHDTGGNAEEVIRPALRPQHFRVRDAEVVARNCDIQVIFERQRHRIIHREIQLPFAQELIET